MQLTSVVQLMVLSSATCKMLSFTPVSWNLILSACESQGVCMLVTNQFINIKWCASLQFNAASGVAETQIVRTGCIQIKQEQLHIYAET